MITVGIFVGGRADYAPLKPLMQYLNEDPEIDVHMGLLPGWLPTNTLEDFKDSFIYGGDTWVDEVVSLDFPEGYLTAAGDVVRKVGRGLESVEPDFLIVLGDRLEALMAASAALLYKVPVVHLHGGETTLGSLDNQIRNAISKLASIHCVAMESHREKLLAMGEESWRIHVTGAPAMDSLRGLKREMHPPEYVVVAYNPVTLAEEDLTLGQVFTDLGSQWKGEIYSIPPGHDLGYKALLERIEPNGVKHCDDLAPETYHTLLAGARALIGNSSSGFIEASALHIPVLNIGRRQEGRTLTANILHAQTTQELGPALKRVLSEEFYESCGLLIGTPWDPGALDAGRSSGIFDWWQMSCCQRIGKVLHQAYSEGNPGARKALLEKK